MITIDWNLLENVSYRTNLDKSLRNELRKFDKEELFDDIDDMIEHFQPVSKNPFPYLHSIKSKPTKNPSGRSQTMSCYLLAKRFIKPGCVAVEFGRGEHHVGEKDLPSLRRYLDQRSIGTDVQVVTVSDPEGYGEYKPYHFVESEREFINAFFDMRDEYYREHQEHPVHQER